MQLSVGSINVSSSIMVSMLQSAFTSGTLYIGLLNHNAVEPSGNGYIRKRIYFAAPTDETAVTDDIHTATVTNSAAVSFPRSTGVWFPASDPACYWALFTAETGGDMVLCSPILMPVAVLSMSTVVIPAGAATLCITDDDVYYTYTDDGSGHITIALQSN